MNEYQKQLIFDHVFGLTDGPEADSARALIEKEPQAAELFSKLQQTTKVLDSDTDLDCPDYLVESTIARLNEAAETSTIKLQELIASEQKHSNRSSHTDFWRNILEVSVAAAMLMFVAGVLVGPLKFMRYQSYKTQCQTQLSGMFGSLNNYTNDYDGKMPSVATSAGAPWWKVGYQGDENHSNTRHIWLLVKEGYVDPADFLCSGQKNGVKITLSPEQIQQLKDFPERGNIAYSFRITPSPESLYSGKERKAMISDMNPLFESLPTNYSQPLNLRLNDKLLRMNSQNHNRYGQNILFSDGSVEFSRNRRIGKSNTDIFTLQDKRVYQGNETPSCETDVFLAP